MKLSIFLTLIMAGFGVASAQSQIRCFEFGALKDKHTIRFEADGGDVAGSYFIEREYDAAQTETYDFSGSRTDKTITVNFLKYAKLSNPPFEISKAILTETKSKGADVLQVKFIGKKNTPINSMQMSPCRSEPAKKSDKPKRIIFAKGKTSATLDLNFKNPNVRQTFLLGAKKGQTISVFSPGCAIELYYPDNTAYEENSQIDSFGLENIKQTGDYRLVIFPAGEAGACPTTFEIKN